jgi:ABC-type antimicrobial peptide transport system permease subunit
MALGALAAGLLVLAACYGNLLHFWLGRHLERTQEWAVRTALGASRVQLEKLLVIEVALITVVGAAIGLCVASGLLTVFGDALPRQYSRLGSPAMTFRALLFIAVASLGVVVIWFVARFVAILLRGRTRIGAARLARGAGTRKPGRGTVVGLQAAVSTTLAVAAGMVVHSFLIMASRDVGYDTNALVISARYPNAIDVTPALRRLEAVPGVASVGAANRVVVDGLSSASILLSGVRTNSEVLKVSGGFFDAAGMDISVGRPLAQGDEDWRAVVVNETFARRHFDRVDALGQVVTKLDGKKQGVIVGVVRDALTNGLDQKSVPIVYWLVGADRLDRVAFVIRNHPRITPSRDGLLKAILEESDAEIVEVATIGDRLDFAIANKRFVTILLLLFAASAIAVTAIGIIGVVVSEVAKRRREMGIRVAIGASAVRVQLLVLRNVLGAVVLGCCSGLLVGRWLSGSLGHLVFNLQAGNWTTAGASAGLMLIFALLVGWVAVQSSLRLQPAEVLRAQ